MHGSSASTPSPWLPGNYKDWDALLTEAVRQGLDHGKAPANLDDWNYGGWHVIDLEHPVYSMLPFAKGWAGTGEQPLSGGTTTIKQVGRAFGPSQRFTMDWSAPTPPRRHRSRRKRRSGESVVPRPMAGLVRRHDLRAAIFLAGSGHTDHAHLAAGLRMGTLRKLPRVAPLAGSVLWRDGILFIPLAALIALVPGFCAESPAGTTSAST